MQTYARVRNEAGSSGDSSTNGGNPPPSWLSNAGNDTMIDDRNIFRPEPINYGDPDLFERTIRTMKRAIPPPPLATKYVRRGPQMPGNDTPRPPASRAPLAPGTRQTSLQGTLPPPEAQQQQKKLPSFRRYPTLATHTPTQGDAHMANGGETTDTTDVLQPTNLDDISDPLLHLDELIDDFDPNATPTMSEYEVQLPEAAWRSVQNTNPFWRMRDMGDEQKRLWNLDKRPAVLIHFPGCGTRDPSIGAKIQLAREDLSERFQIDGRTLVFLIAHAKHEHSHPNKEPFFVIVYGLTQTQCDELIEKVWHSSRCITFGAEPRSPKPSWLIAAYVHYE